MRKFKDISGILIFFLFLLYFCKSPQQTLVNTFPDEENSSQDNLEAPLYSIDQKICNISGITKSYRILFVNDLHIILPNEEVKNDKLEEVKNRQLLFSTPSGLLSSDYWLLLAPQLAAENADAIVFNGDILDYMSEANYEHFLSGLSYIDTPYMFLKADHDTGLWYGNYGKKEKSKIKEKINDMNSVEIIENDEIIIAGINMSTSQITPEGLDALKDIFSLGKPIVLVTHVPLNSLVDKSLYDSSLEAWNERALIWGENCTYEPNAETQEYLDMVYNPNSPVIAVIGAHLHYPSSIMLTECIPQFVFDASYKGTIGELIISE